MGDFTKRVDEIKNKIENLQKEITPTKSPAVTPATWETLKNNTGMYFDWRERVLADGILYANLGTDATGDGAQDKWGSFFKDRASEASKKVEKFLDKPDKSLQEFIDFMMLQESLFFNAIALMPMARMLGELREDTKRIKEKRGDFVDQYKKIVSMDKDQDAGWNDVKKIALQESQKAMEKLLATNEATRKAITEIGPELLGKVPLPYFGELAEVLKVAIATLENLRPSMEMFTSKAQEVYSRNNIVLTVFKTKREEVKAVVDKYNIAMIWERFNKAAAKTLECAGKAGTDGSIEDAKKFAERLTNASKQIVSEYESAFNEFTKGLEGTLYGTTSSETDKELLETAFFDQFLRDFAPDAFLKTAEESKTLLTRLLSTSPNASDPELRERIKGYMTGQFTKGLDEVKKIDKGSFDRMLQLLAMAKARYIK